MLTYNTQLKKLILPEYGRNIQNMIDHCMNLADRDERTRCANAIVEAMITLVPATGDPKAYRKKLWDHLAIMSDFALDIDWPFEVIVPESLTSQPDHLSLPGVKINNRLYGHVVEMMIAHTSEMPEGPDREALALLLANHIKKLLSANDDGVDDAKVFKDLRMLSHGVLNFDPEVVHLHEFKVLAPPKKKKKK